VITRRRLFLAAAVLVAIGAWLPYWGFLMSAPQYPGESLTLLISHEGIRGDVHEVTTLQQYIGVRLPGELPELRWIVSSLVLLAVMLGLAAATRSRATGRLLGWLGIAFFAAFLVASVRTVQHRLYDVGHERDRSAPITAIKDFTPHLIGPTKVGNFTVWSFPHVGAIALAVAMSLTIAGAIRKTHV